MRVIEFSRLATFCVTAIVCADVASAQTCQVEQRKAVSVGGYYSFSAIGNGLPGSLLATTGTGGTGATTGTPPPFSGTQVGQLVSGIASTGPSASSGILFFDSSMNILASPTVQDGVTAVVGTYTLGASDCTITVTLKDAFGSNTTATSLQGIVLQDGSEIDLGMLQNLTTGAICNGSSTGTCTSTSTAPAVNTLYGSNILVRLVRQQPPSCKVSNLIGTYALIGNGTRVATLASDSILGAQTEAPFFTFGLVQFDGIGNIISQAGTSSLSYLQFAGTYTVNTDCTGTMALSNATNSSTSGSTGTATTGTSVNFVLIQPSASGPSSSPVILFSQSGSGQTLYGTGIAQ
jgi:hypothetical protein